MASYTFLMARFNEESSQCEEWHCPYDNDENKFVEADDKGEAMELAIAACEFVFDGQHTEKKRRGFIVHVSDVETEEYTVRVKECE